MKIPGKTSPREPKRVGKKVYNSRHWRGTDTRLGLRDVILQRDNYLCKLNLMCERDRPNPANQVHHKKPIADGGDESRENLIAVCDPCHTKLKQQAGAPLRS